ncbi:MAG: hypothetical protein HRT61_07165 [Ekhidna sp.]|nr:hypothetical protein [Ekhidna sp.]
MIRQILIGVLIILRLTSFSQAGKDERESRIKKQDLPTAIISLLDPYLSKSKHIRFYKEEDGKSITFEVKLTWNKKRYSIEFDTLGVLQDVEVVIKEREIDQNTLIAIKNHLSSFSKYRIIKIQKQYSSKLENSRKLLDSIFSKEAADTIRFEVEVSVKENGNWQGYEILYSERGAMLLKRKIISRSSDFILY